MNKKIYISIACAFAVNTMLIASEDLGIISVESSTIDDKFDARKLEVSNTITISGADVEEYHAKNIALVLNNIPGLTVRENEGDSNKIHIRGIASETYRGEKPGVAIVIDGVPVQERAGSVNIDMDNIESIKVIKGGASYLYGNDALAGAIIITTKRPKGNNKGLVSVEYGSYNYQKYLARYNASTENYAVQVQASKKSTDGYWENSDYWAKSFNGKFQYYIDDSSDITLGLDKSTRFENDTGSLTGTDQADTNPTSKGEVNRTMKYDIELDKYFLTYSKDLNNNANFMTQIYTYEDTTINRSTSYDSDSDGIKDDHRTEKYAHTKQNGLKSEYRVDGEKIAYMFGLDLAKNKENKNTKYRIDYTDRSSVLHPIGEVSSKTVFDENINALYGELKYKINDKLTTSVNARLDTIKYDYTNTLTSTSWDKTYNEESYKIGATYKLKENEIIYTNTSTGFRTPAIGQLFADDILSNGIFNYNNNTEIKTEKTTNYEIGFRNKKNKMTYNIAIYQLDRKNVIGLKNGNYTEELFLGYNAATYNRSEYGNMSDIQNRGLELSLSNHYSKNTSYALNYTYLDSKYTKYDTYNLIISNTVDSTHDLSGNTVPRTSKHTINIEGKYKVKSNLFITAEINYRTSQYADELNRIKVDGYSVVNLRTKYNTKLSNFPIEFFAQIDNVLDKQYYIMPRVYSDVNSDGVYDTKDMGLTVSQGRTYLAGLSVKF